MENNKKNVGRIVIIVLLVIFILLAAGIAINMMRMRKTFMKLAEGSFVYRDGVETYMEHGQVVIDKLVNVDGKIYYVDNEGHKVKDTWAIIDNDGHYGYFGNFGDLVVNKIRTINGKDYYFDENGVLYQDKTEKQIKMVNLDLQVELLHLKLKLQLLQKQLQQQLQDNKPNKLKQQL